MATTFLLPAAIKGKEPVVLGGHQFVDRKLVVEDEGLAAAMSTILTRFYGCTILPQSRASSDDAKPNTPEQSAGGDVANSAK